MDVAQQLVLGVKAIEDRMRQTRRTALKRWWIAAGFERCHRRRRPAKYRQQVGHIPRARGLVQSHAQGNHVWAVAITPQVDAGRRGTTLDLGGLFRPELHPQRVEAGLPAGVEPEGAETTPQTGAER